MVKKYLENRMGSLLDEKSGLEKKEIEVRNRIKEIDRFIEILEEQNDTSFESFTPREVNAKNKEKIKELETEKKSLQKNATELNNKKQENEKSIEELFALLQYLRQEKLNQREREVQKEHLLEHVSRENSEKKNRISEKLDEMNLLVQKMEQSLQFLGMDQMRCKLELGRLFPQFSQIVEQMKEFISIEKSESEDTKNKASISGYIEVPLKTNNLKIDFMTEKDIEEIYQSFEEEKWNKPRSLFELYYQEQKSEKRKVYVAKVDNQIAGYATLLDQDTEGPFAYKGIPVIYDFNVLKKYQHEGVGTVILDKIERDVSLVSDMICLGVGLYTDYGAAQRLYVKRGYVPDGSGVWYCNKLLKPYAECRNDDSLVLYLSKQL